MNFQTLNLTEFQQLKQEVVAHPRMHGEYLMDLVSIEEMRQQGISEKDLLDLLYCHWARVPSVDDLLHRGEWDGYEIQQEHISQMLIYSLQGGGSVGQTIGAIAPDQAASFAQRFLNFFDAPRAFWGLGIGDSKWVFENGLLLLDQKRAGLLLVLEND